MDSYNYNQFKRWLWETHRIDEGTQTQKELEIYLEEYEEETNE